MGEPFTTKADACLPIIALTTKALPTWVEQQSEQVKHWVATTHFKAASGSLCFIPNTVGKLDKILFGFAKEDDFWSYGGLPRHLPKGQYQIECAKEEDEFLVALAWGLGHYQFDRYKKRTDFDAELFVSSKVNFTLLCQWIESIYLVRDLINTPVEDMGPPELAEAVVRVGNEFGAKVRQITGDDLLKQNYATIHTVGRAGQRAPRLIDLQWGDPSAPKVTLVGKGVCFDSGGLDIKPAANMLTMKKDMAGAAHALALGRMIMAQKLPVRLRILIPAVENLISSNAYRPGDVIKTRSGKTIEVTNTDAEGRLVLCDALAQASDETPDCLFDFATLTGAAVIGLGPDIGSLFCNDDALAENIVKASAKTVDPLWRMPLYRPYHKMLHSDVADMVNAATTQPGAITAALYLQAFVKKSVPWAHFDIMAWNTKTVPGKPIGGDAQVIRAVFYYLQEKYR